MMAGPVAAEPAGSSEAALQRLTSALAANADRYDRTAGFPWDSVAAVHDAGILTLGIAERYGGRGLSLNEAVRVMQALGRSDPSVALPTAMTVLQ